MWCDVVAEPTERESQRAERRRDTLGPPQGSRKRRRSLSTRAQWSHLHCDPHRVLEIQVQSGREQEPVGRLAPRELTPCQGQRLTPAWQVDFVQLHNRIIESD